MSISFTISAAFQKLIREMASKSQKAEFYAFMMALMTEQAPGFVKSVRRGFSASKNPRTKLASRSGLLSRSVEARVTRVQGIPTMRIGVFTGDAVNYAGIQEEGTQGLNRKSPYPTLTPRKAKAIAIPNKKGPAVYASGSPKYASPRDYPTPLVFIPFIHADGPIFGMLAGARAVRANRRKNHGRLNLRQIQAIYFLARKIDIPSRRWLSNGVKAYVPRFTDALIRKAEKYFAS